MIEVVKSLRYTHYTVVCLLDAEYHTRTLKTTFVYFEEEHELQAKMPVHINTLFAIDNRRHSRSIPSKFILSLRKV